MSMMLELECNNNLSAFACLQMPAKAIVNLRVAQEYIAQCHYNEKH